MAKKAIDFGEDATKKVPQDKMEALMFLAREQVRAAKEVAKREEDLKDAKRELKRIQEGELPTLMKELGVQDLTLGNGYKLLLTTKYTDIGIPAGRKEECYKWLEEHDHGNLLRREFVIAFNKGEESWARKFQRDLGQRKKKVDSTIQISIPPATVRKVLVDMRNEGQAIPPCFKFTECLISEIKGPKND